jgi:hypothetical protein
MSLTLNHEPHIELNCHIEPVEMDNLMKQQCNETPQTRISFLYKNGFSTLIKKAKFDE